MYKLALLALFSLCCVTSYARTGSGGNSNGNLRTVKCPPANTIIISTNSRDQICWNVNDNLADSSGRLYLDCLANKPTKITGPALFGVIDTSYFVAGETYLLCYYPTNPSGELTNGELWIRLKGCFKQIDATTFQETTSPTNITDLPEKQIG